MKIEKNGQKSARKQKLMCTGTLQRLLLNASMDFCVRDLVGLSGLLSKGSFVFCRVDDLDQPPSIACDGERAKCETSHFHHSWGHM